MAKNSKIDIVQKVLMLVVVASADIAEFLAVLGISIPIIGPVLPMLAWFYGFTVSAIIYFWLIMIGVSIKWFLGGSGLELIPVLNALPFRSAAIIATLIEDELPEKAKKMVHKAIKGGKNTAEIEKPLKT